MEALFRPHRKRCVRRVCVKWGAQTRGAKSHFRHFFDIATCTMQSCHADLTVAAMIMPEGVHPSLLVSSVPASLNWGEAELMTENDSAKEVDQHTDTSVCTLELGTGMVFYNSNNTRQGLTSPSEACCGLLAHAGKMLKNSYEFTRTGRRGGRREQWKK